jgi:hypothetical protein
VLAGHFDRRRKWVGARAPPHPLRAAAAAALTTAESESNGGGLGMIPCDKKKARSLVSGMFRRPKDDDDAFKGNASGANRQRRPPPDRRPPPFRGRDASCLHPRRGPKSHPPRTSRSQQLFFEAIVFFPHSLGCRHYSIRFSCKCMSTRIFF